MSDILCPILADLPIYMDTICRTSSTQYPGFLSSPHIFFCLVPIEWRGIDFNDRC